VTVLGPALVRLTADTVAGDAVYGVRVERTPQTGMYESMHIVSGFQGGGTHGEITWDAVPETTYRFRAMAVSAGDRMAGSVASDEMTVRTPAEPDAPPSAPTHLVAHPASSFAIALEWDGRGDDAYGFQVERRTGAEDFTPIAFVESDRRRFVVHGLAPEDEASFRNEQRGDRPDTSRVAAPGTARRRRAPAGALRVARGGPSRRRWR
jgi:hypothetical protein